MEEPEENKKPEPKKRGRFSGMKSKNKKRGLYKKKPKRPNSSKKALNDYQDTTRKEFLRRVVGETQEEWEKRTARKRIYGVSAKNKIRISSNGEMRAFRRNLQGKVKETKLIITTRFLERPFEYLKCYAFIMRWACVRFDAVKDDVELGYYFYGGEPFTKEEFLQACMQLGTVRGVFNRFWRNGYIMPCSIISRSGTIKNTEYFSLSIEFILLIKRIYAVISKVAPMQLGTKHHRTKQNEELMELLIKMNTEIEETITGVRNQDKILFRNEPIDE